MNPWKRKKQGDVLPGKLYGLEAEATVCETLQLKCVGSIGSQPILETGLKLASLPAGKNIYMDELEDIAVVGLARTRDEKFACIKRCVGGSEGDETSDGICGLPLERGTEFRFENGERDPLEVGAARTSLKNRAGRGESEERDRSCEYLSREHLGAGFR